MRNIVLSDSNPSFDVKSELRSWIDPTGIATIEEAVSDPARFDSAPASLGRELTGDNALWIKLRVLRVEGNTDAWTLNVPIPAIDSVRLFQKEAGGTGKWSVQTAGDTWPQSAWARRGFYADFDLSFNTAGAQDVYLQIRDFHRLNIPIRIANKQTREFHRLVETLLMGLMVGGLLSVAALSLIRYKEHRNPTDLRASVYGLLILLSVAQFSGINSATLWSSLPQLGNYASSILPLFAVGVSLLFVRDLYALSTQYHRYDAFLAATGWGTLAWIASFLVLDRVTADSIGSAIIFFASTVGLAAAVLSWRGGSPIWAWMLLAYVPQYLGVIRLVLQTLGLVPTLWEARYYTAFAVALSVPSLVYALSKLTHDRAEVKNRAEHLPTQDALTGLLTLEKFSTHLQEAYSRAIESREPIALVMVRVVNHEHIRNTLGDPVAEQSLLRAVVKLHRVLRDVDPAGRVDTAQFALLLESVPTRQVLTERMVQLIASGLIPLPGLTPPVTLQFHVACVLLHENPVPPESALGELEEVLDDMSPHTHRPIRFLEAVPTQAGILQAEELAP
ncbi:sensor domain-containing diguanylate cyclase [Rhodoferax aquaticus]|nr:7TM diverse intracellular signaling domain-containing protein [Rhodoferax aquaticus]